MGIARAVELDFQGLGGERWEQQACLEVGAQPWALWAGREHSYPVSFPEWEARLGGKEVLHRGHLQRLSLGGGRAEHKGCL